MNLLVLFNIILMFIVIGGFCTFFLFPYLSDIINWFTIWLTARIMARKYKKKGDIETFEAISKIANHSMNLIKKRGLWDNPWK